MSSEDVFVVATGCVPVGKHAFGMGRKLALEAGIAALKDAGLEYKSVDAFYAGVALPSSPWAVHVAKDLGLTGAPVFQLFNASASGLAAVHEAINAIRSGRHDVILVMGYDVPADAANPLAAQGFLPPPALFAMWARERMEAVGTKREHLAMVAAKNWNYARHQPHAARRSDHEVTVEEVLASKMVADPLTAMMCTPWVFGAAAIVLASREGLKRIPGLRFPLSRIDASEAQSEVYTGPAHIIEGAVVGPPEISRSTVAAALDKAGYGPKDVDIVQVHDGFAIEELVYCELFGFTEPGETERMLEQGAFGPRSRQRFGLPEFSTDGGLIGRGHPAGPSGVFQHIESLRRFRDHGDRIGICHLLGAGSTCITQIVSRVDQL
ncbi:thiolase family protein [Rhizobium pusense]|uniref:thiolase family protein n=1 Tax=Agrobacterium pusense TaxID=648995 RepID=UPI001FCE0323|nr:thiolase family protein [Agrobacterium pusense]